ncbi:MAG: serine/threonine protein kinase [Limisphaerales bacterium]
MQSDSVYKNGGQFLFAPPRAACYQINIMANEFQDGLIAPPSQERFGRFYLQELLNRGGMADIWFVTDGRGKPYALRKLKKELRFNFLARRRFLRGCEVLSKLNDCDFIISYVEHGKADGSLYLLMDYVEASSLKELFARHDPILTENVAQILIDTAAGLGEIHESGFMHLDFKPENVLVTRNGNVRLIDFDLAQPIPETPKKMSKNPGTPGYMAPEQLQRQPLDSRADIFSYGVAAYELVTNQKPFPGETPAEILAAQMNISGPIPVRDHNPEIPADLEKVILKCLAREPDHRYPFMGVLLRDLQKALYV